MSRKLKFYQSIHEALDLCMLKDPSVFIIGLGVPDPKGIFGTTIGLDKKYGSDRVMDMPVAENGMTGVVIGSALVGMRPVMVHQRLDFALLAIEQLVNQAAKWHYMFSGKTKIPLVVRLIVGRGWGQGPQHSQSLQSWFAHVPGLKVVMPATPSDAKGLLISSIEDNNPVIFIEHRWLHNTFGEVPEGYYKVPLGKARIAREGKDVSIVATSFMLVEALHAAVHLEKLGINAEVIDVRTLKPLDEESILESVRKTGHLIAADTSWKFGGFAGEILALVSEKAFSYLKSAPQRVALPDISTPTSPALSKHFYPGVSDLVLAALKMLNIPKEKFQAPKEPSMTQADVPDSDFTGPF